MKHLRAYFFIVGVVLILAFLFHAYQVLKTLQEEERKLMSTQAARLIARVASEPVATAELNVVFEQVIEEINFPIVITDAQGTPIAWANLEVPKEDRSASVLKQVEAITRRLDREIQPIPLPIVEGLTLYLHHGYSASVMRMRWLPIVEIGVAGLFFFVTILWYRNIKQIEQRYIWIGMARETAHQLGTPLSSLMGWLELLRVELDKAVEKTSGNGHSEHHRMILDEMDEDIQRLTQVATRFSQIGSNPELQQQDIRSILTETVRYFRQRLPHQGKSVEIEEVYETLPEMPVNRDLLAWVIENLLKNALDATEEGPALIRVTAQPTDAGKAVAIRISDNGRGIPPALQKQVFEPGYTTKKRGWGLGLTLARRIIEEYHNGKIFIQESRLGVGTTIEIQFPIRIRAAST